MKRTILGLAALATIVLSGPASANLVANGSFETGDFTGWTLAHGTGTGNTAAAATALDFVWPDLGIAPYIPEQGDYFALLGDGFGVGATLTQTINAPAHEMLDLIYFVSTDGVTGTDSFSIKLNGTTIPGSVLTNDFSTSWTQYQFRVESGSGTSDTLQVMAFDTNGFMLLDNVRIGIPEPASIALLGSGLLAAGAFRRRRRVRKA